MPSFLQALFFSFLTSLQIFTFIALAQLRIRPKTGMISWSQSAKLIAILWCPIYIIAASLLIALFAWLSLSWSTSGRDKKSFRQICLLTLLNLFVFHPLSRIHSSESSSTSVPKLKDFGLSMITNFVKLCLFTNLMVLGTFSQQLHLEDQQILPSELRIIYLILVFVAAIQTYLQFLYFNTDWKPPTPERSPLLSDLMPQLANATIFALIVALSFLTYWRTDVVIHHITDEFATHA
ncbi:Oidioi.mRNA.OKI2018_I69.XSR.g16437.t1.cds [Oikopleura dioica]|uniref:Oidioi.mRNA.OKI2018_I69.XSR.g16437.t1.cds n=1 Tax=Oikopleura dioica TaxID=34765 RepID=A0ABN7SMG8_OIKDI|nr:Oidioi.mRNA.OKI2018_I69.XSR.g16437.t1.cds [Oikopleura dioica]